MSCATELPPRSPVSDSSPVTRADYAWRWRHTHGSAVRLSFGISASAMLRLITLTASELPPSNWCRREADSRWGRPFTARPRHLTGSI